jgi:hypothetical protein
MSFSPNVKEKISMEVIKTLVGRFGSFPDETELNRNAPFHEAFLNAFSKKLEGKVPDTKYLISIASWLHGLNTTLGQQFFESVAHILCDGEKREYTSKKLGNLTISEYQKRTINETITNLSNDRVAPCLTEEEAKLFTGNVPREHQKEVPAIDFSCDVFFQDENSVTAIEMKSVRPNSGEMKGEKTKILEGKAALAKKFPNCNIRFFIGFPFDPTVNVENGEDPNSYDKNRFFNTLVNFKKYFDSQETLVAKELWDFLSGQKNTMEDVLAIIRSIATPEFEEKFQIIRNSKLSDENIDKYQALLDEWHLASELNLLTHRNEILKNLGNNSHLKRLVKKSALDADGNYDYSRFLELSALIS